MQTVSVIGAGTMGAGIAETAVVHGLTVHLHEQNKSQRERAKERITTSLAKAVKREKLTQEDAEAAQQRLHWCETLEQMADTEMVIEAVAEDEAIKVELFQRLDELCAPGVILASNTSSISITKLAAQTNRAAEVVGMHFFNPVPVMKPVEIVQGVKTSSETVTATQALAEQMGKQAFTVSDSPGFAVNRVLMPLINEAVFALQEGVADARTIDSLMKLGCNHPMGPLELADLVGLDVCLSILQVLQRELGDPKFRPCPLLVRYVNAGQLGRKTGQGFYSY